MNLKITSTLLIALMSVVASSAFADTPVRKAASKHSNCYNVEVQRHKVVKDKNKIAGTALGAVAGGLIGNQIGGGTGKKLATVAGAVGGGIAGRKIQDNQQHKTNTVVERRCD